jgi:hypothetical protein
LNPLSPPLTIIFLVRCIIHQPGSLFIGGYTWSIQQTSL